VTFRELKDQIRKFSGDRLPGSQVMTQDAFLGAIINDAVIPDLVGRHDWSWKESVETASFSAGDFRIQMPSTLQDVKVLILHTGSIGTTRRLEHMTPLKFFESWPDPNLEAQAYPTHYTWVNREIWLNYPLNGAWSLRMLGLKRFARMTADGDTPSWLDDDKHMLLVYAGTGFVYQSIEDRDNAAVWFKLYENGVEQWWREDQMKEPVYLGKFEPQGRGPVGEYWKSPFIRSSL
jgi:hypothetical protein